MATGKVAIASLMDTITAGANSVSSLINVTTKGIGMLDATVTKVSTEQRKRHIAAAHTFEQQLIRDTAQAESIAELQVLEFCNKSEQHKQLFERNFNEIAALFAPKPQAQA